MSLKSDVNQLIKGGFTVVYRMDTPAVGAAVYGAATYTLFTIQGGPVHLAYLIGRVIGAGGLATAVTFHLHVCGENADSGAQNANTPNNGLILMPLDVGKLLTANSLARAVITLAVASNGMVASVGLIQLVCSGNTTVNTSVEWMLAYRKLHPESNIV